MTAFARLKPLIVACALLLPGVTAGVAGQKYGVTATVEKNVDFAKFKTYAWTLSRPSPDKTIDGQIVAAVDKELAALGLTKASGQPDVLVTYDSLSRTDVDTKAKPDASGSRPEREIGTLVVALLDPQGRSRVLRLRADKPIGTDRAGLEAVINEVAAELFAQYPTRTKK